MHNRFYDKATVGFASAVAASNLFVENSADSIIGKEEVDAFKEKYGRKILDKKRIQ